jgi:hypothetical protein
LTNLGFPRLAAGELVSDIWVGQHSSGGGDEGEKVKVKCPSGILYRMKWVCHSPNTFGANSLLWKRMRKIHVGEESKEKK